MNLSIHESKNFDVPQFLSNGPEEFQIFFMVRF